MITNKVASAMATQVDRVNRDPDYLLELLEEAERKIQVLQRRLERAPSMIDDIPPVAEHSIRDAVLYNGRPVLTVSQVAKKLGISYWKAYRIVQTGHWLYETNQSGHYMIYADQPLTIPPRKNKKSRREM
jgi:hypothetical protein